MRASPTSRLTRRLCTGAASITLLSTSCLGSAGLRAAGSETPADILPALAGTWTGVLEYADVRTDERRQLPTSLTATLADGALQLAYSYSDPSGLVMNASSVHRALAGGRLHVIGTDTLSVVSVEGFARSTDGSAATGMAVLTGTTIENGIVVSARQQIVLRGDSLIIRKEVGDPPRFRNEYRFRRDGGRRQRTRTSTCSPMSWPVIAWTWAAFA